MTAAPGHIGVSPRGLRLAWPDRIDELPAERLRAACRCARCLSGSAVRAGSHAEVLLVAADLVGHYALNLRFSDGHDRGIYPWTLLRSL